MNYEGGQMSQVSEQNDEIDLKELFAAIWHNWWIVLSSAVIVAVLAGYYAFAVATPLYKASTRFELLDDDAGGSLLGSASGLAALAGISVQAGSSEAAALEDRILSRPFVDEIYEEAGFLDDPIFNASLRPPGLSTKIKQVLLGTSSDNTPTRNDYLVMAVAALKDSMEVGIGDNGIIELTIVHPEAKRAADVANIIVKQSLLDIFERERLATKDSLNYFADQLLGVRADLDAASAAVRDYAIGNNLQSQQELARTSSQLSQLRREIDVIEKGILALDKIGENDFDGSAFAQEHPVVASLTFRRLLNLSRDPSDWKEPTENEIDQAKATLEAQKKTLTVSFNSIEARAKSSGAEALELAALEREVEVQKAIYESVITQFEARSLTSGYERASGRIVELSIPPNSPATPNKNLIVALGIVLGLFVGVGVSLLRSTKSGTVYTLSALKDAFATQNTCTLKSSQIGKLDPKELKTGQLGVSQDLLVSAGEQNKIIGIFASKSNDVAARIALGVSKASSRVHSKTALVDVSNGSLKSFCGRPSKETEESFEKYPVTTGVDLLTPKNMDDLLKVSEVKKKTTKLESEYDLIIFVLPAPVNELAVSRTIAQVLDTAIVVAELAKTSLTASEAIRRILAKTKISEPLLVVT